MATIAVGKMVPGQRYLVDGKTLTFVGTRSVVASKLDATPVKFGYAAFGDRWVFHTLNGEEILYRKGYNTSRKPGLVPANGEVVADRIATIAG
jgi:hypothetical protein